MKKTSFDFPAYFDWNTEGARGVQKIRAIPKPTLAQLLAVTFDDEGLRDGLQGTLVYPNSQDMHRYIDICFKLGITTLTVGIYAEKGSRAEELAFSCLKYMAKKYPTMTPIVVIRPLEPDIAYARECYSYNCAVEWLIFQGSSAPRMWVQKWTQESVLQGLANAIDALNTVAPGKTLATLEDATRATPEFIRNFLKMTVEHKSHRVVFADTTGHLDPWGSYRFISFARSFLDKNGGKNIGIDFHGHRDRNLDIPVALAAVAGGADRLHGVVLGVGERAGNTALDALVYNITRMIVEYGGVHPYAIAYLPQLCRQYATMTDTYIPRQYPLVGDHAFLTSVGIHADAQEKGLHLLTKIQSEKHISQLEMFRVEKVLRTIYTSVDHKELGRIQKYLIGPLSGESTVRMWLYQQGFDITQDGMESIVKRIKQFAKHQQRIVRDEEILEFLDKKSITRKR